MRGRMNLVSKFFIFLIQGLRPLLGPATCKYELTCGKFAVYQLQTFPIHIALWAILKRIASCNPF